MNKKLLLLIPIIVFTGCSTINWKEIEDPLHWMSNRKSPPAYPAYIADEPILWSEGGHIWIDNGDGRGLHQVK